MKRSVFSVYFSIFIVGMMFSSMFSGFAITLPTSLNHEISSSYENQIPKVPIKMIKEEFKPSPSTREIGNKVLLQAYYWSDFGPVVDNEQWWNTLNEEMPNYASYGFDALWLPPSQKSEIGNIASSGYEPYDYYDQGEFYQKERTATKYGTREDLQSLTTVAHDNGLSCIADIVINHNNGGELEENPFVDASDIGVTEIDGKLYTKTDFNNVASGQFPRNYTCFYPCAYGDHDAGTFGNYPDLCHENPYVHDSLIDWGNWMQNYIGYDGWRFDMAGGIDPSMIEDWMNDVGGFGVVEYWNGMYIQLQDQLDYLDALHNSSRAFDFLLTYEFHKMAAQDGAYDMRNLEGAGLVGVRPNQTITFVVNHDTNRNSLVDVPEDRNMSYAYILTHEGYPMIYWEDFYNFDLQRELRSLLQIHNSYAVGATDVLYADDDLYVMQRSGDPGLILIMNDNPTQSKSVEVSSKWRDTTLTDLMGRMGNASVDGEGHVTLTAPANGYAVYSVGDPIHIIQSDGESNKVKIVQQDDILLDGELDWAWSNSIANDRYGDGGVGPMDLKDLYLCTDETNLYVGFTYGKYEWRQDTNLDYGIGIDTKSGGNRTDPGLHPLINWATSNIPDYILYLQTDHLHSNHTLNNGTFYVDNGNGWTANRSLVKDVDFGSDYANCFAEVKIPLVDIGLEAGGNFSIKVYTTPSGKPGAADTVPSDTQVDGKGDSQSWLSLSGPYEIPQIESTSSIPPKKGISGYSSLFLLSILGLSSILMIRKKLRTYAS